MSDEYEDITTPGFDEPEAIDTSAFDDDIESIDVETSPVEQVSIDDDTEVVAEQHSARDEIYDNIASWDDYSAEDTDTAGDRSIDTDLTVKKHLNVGGNTVMNGTAHAKKDVLIEGWLVAPNIWGLRDRVRKICGLDTPTVKYVDRGAWNATAYYYYNEQNDSGDIEISEVWYNGCKWRCQKTGTHTAPRWNNTDWLMIYGDTTFYVDFAEQESIFDPDNFETTLTITAKLYGTDVTDDVIDSDVVWTRYSEDVKGVQRTNSDIAWNIRHDNAGKSITLTKVDVDFNGNDVPKVLRYTATVYLRDGLGDVSLSESVSIEL